MRASTAFSILALAGSALAAPAPAEVTQMHTVVETVIHTVYATEGYAAPTAAPAPVIEATLTYGASEPAPTKEAPKPKPEPTKEAPKPKPEPTKEAPKPKPTQEAPKPQPSQSYESPAPPADNGYMGVVNEWRNKMGMPELKMNSFLQKSAEHVVMYSKGQMIHHLYDGTGGQVLAPGDAGNEGFTKVFVGGWLCEMPGLPGLNGVCNEMSKGWAYEGQTGHAKILTDPQYQYIGCALDQGIWCCDVSAKEITSEPQGGYPDFTR